LTREIGLQSHDAAVKDRVRTEFDLERLAEIQQVAAKVQEADVVVDRTPVAQRCFTAVESADVFYDKQAQQALSQFRFILSRNVDDWSSILEIVLRLWHRASMGSHAGEALLLVTYNTLNIMRGRSRIWRPCRPRGCFICC